MLIKPLEIFQKSWQIFKANWRVLGGVTSWLLIPAFLLGFLGFLDQKLGHIFVNYSVLIYLALSALTFVLGLWANIVLARLIYQASRQLPTDRKMISREAWRDTVSYLWVSVLAGLIIMGGMLLFLVPGFIFAVWYSLATLVFVLEGVKGYAALKRSQALVRGRFWPVVWRWVVPYFFYLAIMTILVGLPSLLVGYFIGFADFSAENQPWWFNFWQSIIAILLLPLSAGFGVVLYSSLKDDNSNPQIKS